MGVKIPITALKTWPYNDWHNVHYSIRQGNFIITLVNFLYIFFLIQKVDKLNEFSNRFYFILKLNGTRIPVETSRLTLSSLDPVIIWIAYTGFFLVGLRILNVDPNPTVKKTQIQNNP